MANQRSVLKLAKELYGKEGTVRLQSLKTALAGQKRTAAQQQLAVLREEQKELKARLAGMQLRSKLLDELLKMAQFVVDVCGDPPSIPLLAEALLRYTSRRHAEERQLEVDREISRTAGELHRYRCEVRIFYGPGYRLAAGADDWTQLEAQLLAEKEKRQSAASYATELSTESS